jgi:hypothetical protein
MSKTMIINKRVCEVCDWRGVKDQVLHAANPFTNDKLETISGCPQCLNVETLRAACDELDCWDKVTCGTTTPDGYRSTCGIHNPS